MKFDNEAEEDFYDFLNDFELTSMIKRIESQVDVYGQYRRRVDFVLTLINNEVIYVEVDGKTHSQPEIISRDGGKDYVAEKIGINTIRIKFSDFYRDKETIANKIEAMIDLLS